MAAKVGIVRSPAYLEHEAPFAHPENSDRLRAIHALLDEERWRGKLVDVPAREATRREIALNHREALIDAIESREGARPSMLDPDTYLAPHSPSIARLAAGGVLALVEAVVEGEVDKGFAFVRPPGHHAEAGRPMGFCLYNNIAIAAHWALEQGAAERVLIMDWDVHHGNGTQSSFWEDPRVLYVSTHRYPFYPGTGNYHEVGKGPGEGYTVNVPLSYGTGDAAYLRVFREIVEPVSRQFRPDLVLISAGFDAHARDPLGGMEVTEEGFAAMMGNLGAVADEFADGRAVLVLEGGYDLQALSRSVDEVLRVLVGERAAPTAIDGPTDGVEGVLGRVKTQLAAKWRFDK